MRDTKLESLLTIKSFYDWIKTQDPNTRYEYVDNGSGDLRTEGCALVQYFRAYGYNNVLVSPAKVFPDFNMKKYHEQSGDDGFGNQYRVDLPFSMNSVVTGRTTFGGVVNAIEKYFPDSIKNDNVIKFKETEKELEAA